MYKQVLAGAQVARHKLGTVRVLADAGVVRPLRPDHLLAVGSALARWGSTPAGAFIGAAAEYPDEPAIIDECGCLTFAEVHERTNALANAFAAYGIGAGDGVAVMCRNHRGFIETTVALSKLGADALYLNTAFAGPQLADVIRREQPVAIVYDEEFADLLTNAGDGLERFVAWRTTDVTPDPPLSELISLGNRADLKPPERPGRSVILTSGTTGAPKGAARPQGGKIDAAASLLSVIPLRLRQRAVIAAPLFHAWGLAHFNLGLLLSSTYVLRRKFDPEATLVDIERTRAECLIAVPVMLQRILELPAETRASYRLDSLRAVCVSGSALPGELALRWMDAFGDTLYNLYGSTEVAWATIATPADLRAAPGTAGRPPRGTTLRLIDRRIFVGNEMLFDGYTGGGDKERIDGLAATGDVGRLDAEGRLFIEGRDDDMIVSGGENVFPREVEDLLADHEAVAEAAVVGVADTEFGQRLKAFVVPRPGAALTADDVKSHVKENLARYKVPRDVEFLDALPRNATGKVLKRELQEGTAC